MSKTGIKTMFMATIGVIIAEVLLNKTPLKDFLD